MNSVDFQLLDNFMGGCSFRERPDSRLNAKVDRFCTKFMTWSKQNMLPLSEAYSTLQDREIKVYAGYLWAMEQVEKNVDQKDMGRRLLKFIEIFEKKFPSYDRPFELDQAVGFACLHVAEGYKNGQFGFKKNLEKAIEFCDKGIKYGNGFAYCFKGEILAQREDLLQIITHWQDGIKNPQFSELKGLFYNHLGTTFLEMDHTGRARNAFRSGAEVGDGDSKYNFENCIPRSDWGFALPPKLSWKERPLDS